MRRFIFITIVSAITILGCNSNNDLLSNDSDQSTVIDESNQYGRLIRGTWNMVSFTQSNGETVSISSGSEFNFSINFPNEFSGRANGEFNCNSFTGEYLIEDSVLNTAFEPVANVLCQQEQNESTSLVNTIFFSNSPSSVLMSFDDSGLLSLTSGANESLHFMRLDTETITRNIDFSLVLTGDLIDRGSADTTQDRFQVVRNQPELLQLYSSLINCEQCAVESPPLVDFEKMSVIFIASELQQGLEAGIEIAHVILNQEKELLTVDIVRPTIAAECPVGGAQFRPFAIYQINILVESVQFTERTEIREC